MPHLSSLSAIMVDSAVKATLLLVLAWVCRLLLGKSSAAARHFVQALFLGALLLVPFSGFLPGWHVRGIPDFVHAKRDAAARVTHPATLPAPAPVITDTAATAAPSPTRTGTAVVSIKSIHQSSQTLLVGPSAKPQQTRDAEPAAPAVPSTSTTEDTWPNILFFVWLSGAVYLSLRWLISTVWVFALIRRARPVSDHSWNVQARAVAGGLGVRREIIVLESEQTEVPLAAGIFRPKVILPPDHGEWSELRRQSVLQHEIAHIARLDALTHVAAQAATTLYWFHPLAWLLARAMRNDRECACDDQVLAAGTKASEYAHELLDIVANLRQAELPALAMARRSQLEGRVLAVLNPKLRRGPVSRWATLAIAITVLAIVLPVAAIRPAAGSNTQEFAGHATTAQQLDDLNSRIEEIKYHQASTRSQDGTITAQTTRVIDEIAALKSRTDSHISLNDDIAARIEDLRMKLAVLEEQTGIASRAPEAPPAPASTIPHAAPEAPGVPAVPASPAAPGTPASPGTPAVPAVPAPPAAGAGELSVCNSKAQLRNISLESRDGHRSWTASWSGDECSVDLKSEGQIQFSADATEIQSITPGGFFEVNVREGDRLRRVRVTPSGNGLEYVLKVNGNQQPFDANAKAWFGSLLLSLERATGFAADTRVPRLLAKGGPTAVLDEINNLSAAYVRGIYFRKLLDQPNLPPAIVVRIMNQAAGQMASDYELARVLMEVSKQYDLPDETSRTAFLNAAGKLKSDYEHSRVLIELLKRPDISAENVRMALNSATNITSDYEKSRILLSLIDQREFNQTSLDFYLKLVASIHSDYEKSRDLLAAMQRYPLASGQVNQILDAATKMSSDYEKSRLLTGLSEKGKFDESQMGNYLKVVASMQSDYERSRCLISLMQHNTLSSASVSKALQATAEGKNNEEKARVLTSLISYNFDQSQIKSYLFVVESMSSAFEQSRCLVSLMEHAKLNEAELRKLIEVTGRIGSDYEKARVLVAVSSKYSPLSGALRESYIKSAESIGNEYERNRALAAVVRRASL